MKITTKEFKQLIGKGIYDLFDFSIEEEEGEFEVNDFKFGLLKKCFENISNEKILRNMVSAMFDKSVKNFWTSEFKEKEYGFIKYWNSNFTKTIKE